MKIAVISDIHGNLSALEAVLKDIEIEDCDKIFCLGDLSLAGASPSEIITKIQELMNSRDFTIIQGNTDELIANGDKKTINFLKEKMPIMGNALELDIDTISEQQKEFLRNLPKTKEININGIKIFLAHGSPRLNNENITPDLPLEKVEEMISSTAADLILVGHTHVPCGYQTNTKQTVVNVGSVGRPLTPEPNPCYAIIEIDEKKTKSFSIRHSFIKYDNKKESDLLRKRNFVGSEKIAEMLINPTERYPK